MRDAGTSTISTVRSTFHPPTVKAPPRPLPLWRFLPTFLRNPLRALPAPVFHEPIVIPPAMRGRLAWITDPSLVERILLKDHEQFPKTPVERRVFEAIIGDGILTSEGAVWRWQRRTVAPLFRHSELLAGVPQVAAAARSIVERWHAAPSGTVHRIDHDMTDATFDVLQRTIFAGATAQEADVLKRHIGAYLEWTSWDIAYEILRFPPNVWHPRKRAMRRAADALQSTMRAIIERERANGWTSGGLMARLGAARDPETQTPMSDKQIAHNLMTFAAAGHETTAKALTWTLYLLARSPDWQQKVRDEVQRVVQSDPIEAHHVDQLIVTAQVLKEAMRLYPPAPIMGRMTREPIDIAGHQLPAGALLIIPIYAIHRHRALWIEPDAFDPTRFVPELEKQQKRTQYMPFGFGPRTCIGMNFAMIEAIVLLAEMIRSAEFTCSEDLAPEPLSRVTLRPRHGMPIAVRILETKRAA